MLKKVLSTALGMAMALSLTCTGALAADSAENAVTTDGLTIGYSVQTIENAYFVGIVNAMEKAAKEKGIKLIVADAQSDASKHINQIEDFLSQGVDAIIISPVDGKAPESAVKDAHAQGVPVIALDQEVEGEDAFFGTDNYAYGFNIGSIAGEWLNKKEADGTIGDVLDSNGEIEVVVVRYDALPSVIERGDGMKDGLTETYTGDKEIKFVYEQDAVNADQGYELGDTALTANPEVSIFICVNDASALGVYEACLTHKEHTADNTCVVGADALDEALKLVANDTMYKGTVLIDSEKIGSTVLDIAAEVLANGPKEESQIYEMTPISEDNISEFYTAE